MISSAGLGRLRFVIVMLVTVWILVISSSSPSSPSCDCDRMLPDYTFAASLTAMNVLNARNGLQRVLS